MCWQRRQSTWWSYSCCYMVWSTSFRQVVVWDVPIAAGFVQPYLAYTWRIFSQPQSTGIEPLTKGSSDSTRIWLKSLWQLLCCSPCTGLPYRTGCMSLSSWPWWGYTSSLSSLRFASSAATMTLVPVARQQRSCSRNEESALTKLGSKDGPCLKFDEALAVGEGTQQHLAQLAM
jgi:hypothetical protein